MRNPTGKTPDGAGAEMMGRDNGMMRRKDNTRISIKIRAALFKLALDDTVEYTRDIERGNLLFALRHAQPSKRGPQPMGAPDTADVFGKYTRETPVMVTHFLNYMMGRLAQAPPKSMPDGPTPAFVVEEMQLLGIVTTAQSTTEAASNNGGCPELAVDYECYNTQMSDIYASHVKYGMRLWLVSKWIPFGPNTKYRPLSTSHRDERLPPRRAITEQRITHVPAVVPLITSSRFLPASQLLTRIDEDDGVPTYKQAYPIRVGMVFEGARTAAMSPEVALTARRDLLNTTALPHAGAVFDAGKSRDFGLINIMPDPYQ